MSTILPGPAAGTPLQQDRDSLPELLSEVLDEATQFIATLPRRRPGARQPFAEQLSPAHHPGGSTHGATFPDDRDFGDGKGARATLRHWLRRFDDHIVASSGPRYLGYVPGGVTPAALAGDRLASAYDQNPPGLRWFGDASEGTRGLQVRVFTATPPSSAVKALRMVGLGSSRVQRVATLPGREAMDVADLERQLAQRPDAPAIVIASAGTVNTADFNDFRALQALRDRYRFWLHIDAAFGGFAALLPAGDDPAPDTYPGGRLRDWEYANSITVDNHKWPNMPYGSGTWFIRKEHVAFQHNTFRNGDAPYLNQNQGDYNYLNLGPENSRRLRALPVWFTLQRLWLGRVPGDRRPLRPSRYRAWPLAGGRTRLRPAGSGAAERGQFYGDGGRCQYGTKIPSATQRQWPILSLRYDAQRPSRSTRRLRELAGRGK
ncbi:pyridoxal phosphate-dependent decarboxylase family protein [Lewinella sp. IMCC34191]|uniref:pyridoxal phosphate-dependent decarboxylase family protein n=1 Tax=Lewinella sp. IMCC34191 TaxID=2259172 RepID=UPI000E23E602|nr:pyridoxal-dependent decarboxylase [Lewinella sp. IMCC34191]